MAAVVEVAVPRIRELSPAERALARKRAAAALEELESGFEAKVRAAFRKAFAVTDDIGAVVVMAVVAASPEGFTSADDINAIPALFGAEIEATLLPAIGELFATGGMAALLTFGPATAKRQAEAGVDALGDVLERRGLVFLEGARNRLVGVGETAWMAARDALSAGFAAGESIPQMAARVQEAVSMSIERAVLVARTEVTAAVNAGQLEAVRAIEPYGPAHKQWLATLDSRTRPDHAEADGQTVLLDEPFNVGGESLDAPGDGSAEQSANCRCVAGATPVAAHHVTAMARRWHDGPMVALRTVLGEVVLTPDHPVATSAGWVAAGSLDEGDEILGVVPRDRIGGSPEVHDVQPSIEYVWASVHLPLLAQRVRSADVDLDRYVPGEHQVDVVATDLYLPLRDPAQVEQESRGLQFTPTHREMSRPDSAADLLGIGEADQVGGTSGTDRDLGVGQDGPDDLPGEAVLLRQRQLALAGFISGNDRGGDGSPTHSPIGAPSLAPIADHPALLERFINDGEGGAHHIGDILKAETERVKVLGAVHVERWSGHVYDLQTDTGSFIAAGIIVHNCTLLYVDEPGPIDPDGRQGLPVRASMEADMAVTEPELAPVVNDGTPGVGRTFEVLLCVEGRWTGDERIIMADALTWDGALPLPLTLSHDDHPNAVVGIVTEVERRPGPTPEERLIVGRGIFDDGFDEGAEAVRKIEGGFLRGVSIDMDAVVEGGVEPDENDPSAGWRYVVETGRIRALALTSLPAFAEAYITLDVLDTTELPPPPDPNGPTPLGHADAPTTDDDGVIILASGTGYRVVAAAPAVDAPPFEWFANPHLDGPAPLHVSDDGHVTGHLALWGVCHTGINGSCVTAPRTASGYAGFLLGEVQCADGSRVPVGKLTVGGGHADPELGWRAAVDHYDRTSAAVADVFVGEDAYGIWCAGAVRASATPSQIAELRASPLSGDWRRMGNRLELVAALAVNVPGFPVPRVTSMVADGRQMSLVAAGVVDPGKDYGSEVRLAAAERIASTIGRDRYSLAAALIARAHPNREV